MDFKKLLTDILNKISLKIQSNQIRLNLVGGETFLYKDALKEIVNPNRG